MYVKDSILNVHFINYYNNFKEVEGFHSLGKQHRKLEIQSATMKIDLAGMVSGV